MRSILRSLKRVFLRPLQGRLENYQILCFDLFVKMYAGVENDLNAEQFNFLAELTPYCIEARYGDYRESLSEIINE